MFYFFVEILATFFEISVLLCICNLFFEKRQQGIRYWGAIILLSILMTALTTYLNGIVLYSYATMSIWILLATIAAALIYKCNILKVCCLSILYMVIISSFDFLFLVFVEYVLQAPDFVYAVLSGNCIERVIALIILKSVLILSYFFLKIKKWKITINMTMSTILSVFGILGFICMKYLVNMFFLDAHSSTQKIILVAFAFMTLFFVSVMLILNNQEKVKRKDFEKELIEAKLRISEERNSAIVETYQEIAKLSHDFNNQMKITSLLLNDGKIEEAKEYLSHNFENSTRKTKHYTGISSIDAVLSEKIKSATDNNIETNLNINMPSKCNINPTDICTIFLNLIDNAIEACLKIDRPGKGYINITLTNVNSMIVIKIENSTSCSDIHINGSDLPETTKENEKSHGFGLKIVNSIAEKYNGSMVIKKENGVFISTVLLST